jgi:phage gp29-like protein
MADINDIAKLPKDAGQEIGQSGTYMYFGFISAEEYNLDLVGKTGLQVYDIMRKSDATVHATLIVCKNPIIGADWDIQPASSDPVDVEIADYCKRELFSRNIMWQDVLRESLTALDFGHAVMELVYDITEFNGKPRIGLKKIASRKQRSILRWETSDHKDGITQVIPTGQLIDIPRQKLVYIINEREGNNYEGISLLRFAYKPWKIKDTLELMNAIALERMAVGVPIVEKDANNTTSNEPELAKIRTALRQLRANESSYIELPGGVKISMLDMKAQTTKDVLPTIEHQNRQISLSVLAQFLMLGQTGGSGSRAVSADHSTLFLKSLEAVARTVQQPFQNDVINRLVDLNYSNLKNGYPKLVFADLSDDDAGVTAKAVADLMNAKALTRDAAVENRLRNMLSLPEMSQEMFDSYDDIVVPEPNGGNNTNNTPNENKTTVDDAADMPTTTKTQMSILADARKSQMALIESILDK